MVLQSLTGAERRVRLSEWPLWSTWESRLSNALLGSMADYSAPSGLFDGLEWATGSMNMFIRRVIGYAVKDMSWGPIGMENRVISFSARGKSWVCRYLRSRQVICRKATRMHGLTIRRLAGERMIRLAGLGFSDRVTQNRLAVNRGGAPRASRAKCGGMPCKSARYGEKRVGQNQAISGTGAPGRHDYSASVIESPNFKMTQG